jgi:hypothetical protein
MKYYMKYGDIKKRDKFLIILTNFAGKLQMELLNIVCKDNLKIMLVSFLSLSRTSKIE